MATKPTLPPCDRPGSLFKNTLALLKKDSRSRETIARATDMPLSWLLQLENGRIKKPGVNRIQFLFEFLSGQKL